MQAPGLGAGRPPDWAGPAVAGLMLCVGLLVVVLEFRRCRELEARFRRLEGSLGLRTGRAGWWKPRLSGLVDDREVRIESAPSTVQKGPHGRRSIEISATVALRDDLGLSIMESARGAGNTTRWTVALIGQTLMQAGDLGFDSRFLVVATREDVARELLDEDARSAVRHYFRLVPDANLLLSGGRLRGYLYGHCLEQPSDGILDRLRRLVAMAKALEEADRRRPGKRRAGAAA